MPKENLSDAEKVAILELLAQTPKKSQVAAETHHGKAKISQVLNEFRNMPWREARVFCAGRENLLALRPDYVEKKLAEMEECLRANIMAIRHEAGLRLLYINKDGTSVLEI